MQINRTRPEQSASVFKQGLAAHREHVLQAHQALAVRLGEAVHRYLGPGGHDVLNLGDAHDWHHRRRRRRAAQLSLQIQLAVAQQVRLLEEPLLWQVWPQGSALRPSDRSERGEESAQARLARAGSSLWGPR
jgi:hypothetical protein